MAVPMCTIPWFTMHLWFTTRHFSRWSLGILLFLTAANRFMRQCLWSLATITNVPSLMAVMVWCSEWKDCCSFDFIYLSRATQNGRETVTQRRNKNARRRVPFASFLYTFSMPPYPVAVLRPICVISVFKNLFHYSCFLLFLFLAIERLCVCMFCFNILNRMFCDLVFCVIKLKICRWIKVLFKYLRALFRCPISKWGLDMLTDLERYLKKKSLCEIKTQRCVTKSLSRNHFSSDLKVADFCPMELC